MRHLLNVLAAVTLSFGSAAAVSATASEDVPTIDLAEPDELPELPLWEWAVAGNLQLDGLAFADLADPAREKEFELRRARLSGLLQWRFDWLFKAGVDFSEGPEMREMAVEYRGLPVYFELGRIVEPFGVLQGGSRGSALMERPQATGLAPGYGVGLAANARGERWGATGGIYTATKNDVFDEGGREENALTARGTWAPLRDDDWLLHLGLAASRRESDVGLLQFVAIPETVLLRGLNANSPLLVADGGADSSYSLYGAELAARLGPLLLQSEYMRAELDPVFAIDFDAENFIASADPRYSSWYAEVAWAVTGERRDYSTRRGVIGAIHPRTSLRQGGWGALEVAARHSRIDLTDDTIGGERGRVSSVGLNWLPDEGLKLMLNALRVEEVGEDGTETVRAVQARAQLYFSAP